MLMRLTFRAKRKGPGRLCSCVDYHLDLVSNNWEHPGYSSFFFSLECRLDSTHASADPRGIVLPIRSIPCELGDTSHSAGSLLSQEVRVE